MRCSIISRAGQVLAQGSLSIHKQEDGELRLDLTTDGGRLIQGGLIGADGDMAPATQELFRQFFEVWGMSGVTLSVTMR